MWAILVCQMREWCRDSDLQAAHKMWIQGGLSANHVDQENDNGCSTMDEIQDCTPKAQVEEKSSKSPLEFPVKTIAAHYDFMLFKHFTKSACITSGVWELLITVLKSKGSTKDNASHSFHHCGKCIQIPLEVLKESFDGISDVRIRTTHG